MQYSVVQKKELDKIVFRLDAEYYHPELLSLHEKLSRYSTIAIRKAGGKLDCSAFYPSIVPYYNFDGIGVPFLRVNEIQNGLVFLSDDTAFLPQKILDENKNTIAICKSGDLIIAKGGNSLAKVALLTNEHPSYSVCRDVIVLRTNELRSINRFYLWMFLHSNIGKKVLLRTASQTGQPHLTLEAIAQIEIPLFSDKFQSLFEWLYIESQRLNNKAIELYSDANKILLNELELIKWKPKHQLSFIKNYSDTLKAKRIDAEYYQPKYDELLHAINTNSEYVKTISDIQTYNARGQQPKYSIDGCLDVVTSKHILENGLDFNNFEKTNLSNWDDQKKARIKKDDILTYTTGANIGRTAYYHLDKKALASNHVNILRIKGENPEYVAFVMNSFIGRLQTEQMSAGSAQAELYPKDINRFVIPFIAKQDQLSILTSLNESRKVRMHSDNLLSYAQQSVEMAIEQNEKTAIDWLKKRVEELNAC